MTGLADTLEAFAPGRPGAFAQWADLMLGWTPHSYQESFGQSEAKNLYLVCGIRFGKSDAAAARYLHRMFYGPGHRYINAALTQDQANIVVERARDLALQGPLAGFVDRYVKSPFPTLILKNDARLQGRTVDDPNLLRGRPYHGAGVDEGAFAKEEAIRLLKGRTLDHHGWTAIYTTPNGMGSWLHVAYVQALQEQSRGNPGYFAATATTYDNPHIPRASLDELRAECERDGRQRWFDQEVLGQFVDMEGATFPVSVLDRIFMTAEDRKLIGYDIETGPPPPARPGHPISGKVRTPPPIYVAGWDLGRKTTLSVGTVLEVSGERFRGVDLVRHNGTPWPVVEKSIETTQRKWKAHTMIDGSGVGDPIESHLEVPVRPFIFTAKTRSNLITETQAVCHRGGILLPREWNHLYTSMMLHTWKEDAEGQTWDDLDSLMLAIHHANEVTFKGPLLIRL